MQLLNQSFGKNKNLFLEVSPPKAGVGLFTISFGLNNLESFLAQKDAVAIPNLYLSC